MSFRREVSEASIITLIGANSPLAQRQLYIPGQYFRGPQADLQSQTQTFGQLRAVPFILSETVTFDRIAIEVTSAGAATSISRLGIYANGLGAAKYNPGTLLVDAGEIANNAVGIRAIVINQQLAPGVYWLVWKLTGSGAVGSFRTWELNGDSFPIGTLGIWTGSGVTNILITSTGSEPIAAGAFVDPWPFATIEAGNVDVGNTPAVMLRVASVP